jgi:hypothetical protein
MLIRASYFIISLFGSGFAGLGDGKFTGIHLQNQSIASFLLEIG